MKLRILLLIVLAISVLGGYLKAIDLNGGTCGAVTLVEEEPIDANDPDPNTVVPE